MHTLLLQKQTQTVESYVGVLYTLLLDTLSSTLCFDLVALGCQECSFTSSHYFLCCLSFTVYSMAGCGCFGFGYGAGFGTGWECSWVHELIGHGCYVRM
jgi:hypothetical protein